MIVLDRCYPDEDESNYRAFLAAYDAQYRALLVQQEAHDRYLRAQQEARKRVQEAIKSHIYEILQDKEDKVAAAA